MFDLSSLLNPPSGLDVASVLAIATILGVMHGVTPDEHTWPITFSYSVGSYSSKGGMKAGFMFSGGFTIQRAILAGLGFLGMAEVYERYNLDGYVYALVGAGMLAAGYFMLKGTDIHVPLDRLLGSRGHHSERAERIPLPESDVARPVPLRMAAAHGFIAGWGLGAYASIMVFVLAPQMPNVFYASLVGVAFGLGTMVAQVATGFVFANIMRVKSMSLDQTKYVGRSAAARTLYVGGLVFVVIGALIVAFPWFGMMAISTGIPLPNVDSVSVSTALILLTVGVVGLGNVYLGYREAVSRRPGPAVATP